MLIHFITPFKSTYPTYCITNTCNIHYLDGRCAVKKMKMVSTCWIVLLECYFMPSFWKGEMENVWYSRLIFQNGAVACCILSFKGIFQTRVNLSEMQVYYTSLPWKCVITAGYTTHKYWCVKSKFWGLFPWRVSWPKPSGVFEKKCTSQDYFYGIYALSGSISLTIS